MPSQTDEPIRALFAGNIKKFRSGSGMSQEALGDLAGLHRTFIGHVEAGRRNLSIDNIAKIARALKVHPAELFLPLDIENHKN